MRRWRLLFAATLLLPLPGCAGAGWFSPPAPFSDRAPCVLPPGAGKEQIVQHVNRNIQGAGAAQGLKSWQSAKVRLDVKVLPMSIPAQIVVEAPRNFRLRVSEPIGGGELVDMGSNDKEFWFWAKSSPHQNVITASLDELTIAQQELNVPFHPDWLMEVFGVIPIDADSVTLQKSNDPHSSIVELVSNHTAPDGTPIRKVIRIDACHGIVREHALYDDRGVLIASARLADHRIDKETGLITPRVIRLDWPQMQQTVTMRFNDMRVNPPPLPATVWEVPQKPGYPRLELTQLLDQSRARGIPPFGIAGPPPRAMSPPSRQPWENASQSQPPHSRYPVNGPPPGASPPSRYSPGASRSSSAPRRRGRGLFGWPWW